MNNNQPQWTINSQIETMERDNAGNFVNGVRVSFTTAMGDTASVFVLPREYNVETVRGAIAAKVAQLNAVRATGQ